METYIFQAALYCSDCSKAIKERLDSEGVRDSGDSHDYPQGSYLDGGGEADCPQFCDSAQWCLNAWTPKGWPSKVGKFLENPLTSDGQKDLKERTRLRPWGPVVQMCLDFYGIKPIPQEYTIKWSGRETTIKADRIACNQIDLSEDPLTRLWAVANEYGIMGIVWARDIQSALNALVDEDLGAGILVDDKYLATLTEGEREELAHLGNAGEYADLTNAGAWEVDLTPDLREAFTCAEEAGCQTLADLDD